MYTHVYFVHIYTYMFAEILSIWILWALQLSRPDSWAHIERPTCSVCVCVRVHTLWRALTYTPTCVKNRKTQDNTSCSPSFENTPPRQATSVLYKLVEHPHSRSPTWMNKLRTHERMCTPCSDCVTDMYGDVNNTCGMNTSACTGARSPVGYTPRSPQKCAYTRASTLVRQCSNSFAMQTIATYPATSALPKKVPVSTTAHGAAAAALPCKHHLNIRIGTGPTESSWSIIRIHPWPTWRLSPTKFYFHHFRGLLHHQCAHRRSEQLLWRGILSRFTLWWVTADWLWMANWAAGNHNPQKFGRRTHLLYFTYSYYILSRVRKLVTSLLVLRH